MVLECSPGPLSTVLYFTNMAEAQINARPLFLGDEVPNFTANTQLGQITLHSYIDGSWALLFSHPADFTPICTTEIGMLSKLHSEFEARDCRVIGLSVDSGITLIWSMRLSYY
jgi:alkyl hydroperoxide reductase subunit AhpC